MNLQLPPPTESVITKGTIFKKLRCNVTDYHVPSFNLHPHLQFDLQDIISTAFYQTVDV